MKKLLIALSLILILMLSVFLIYPSPIDSVAWQPPAAVPLTGPAAPNQLLSSAEVIARGQVYGPEDVAVDDEGRIYAGTQDGFIKRILTDGSVESWVNTGGRPLGLHFDQAGNLIVCDAYKGLLSIDPTGRVTVLSTGVDGQPFGFADDIDIASDGKIYFTDASSKWNQGNYILDLLETRPYGRFLVYDPATGTTTSLLDKMYFSNGVAISEFEDFVLISETWRYRIIRYWLKGEKAGSHDVFIDNLPGFPDGVSANRKGRFWLALPSLRLPDLDRMHPKPWLKNLSAKLPDWFKPKPVDYGLILELDEAGNIVSSLHDPGGVKFREITSVEEHNGSLYIGSLSNDVIGRFSLSSLATNR